MTMDSLRSALSDLNSRAISRRTALKVIGGGTVATIAAACSPTSSETPSTKPTAATTATPAASMTAETGNVITGTINGDLLPTLPRGGDLTLTMSNPGGLNPLTDTAAAVRANVSAVHDKLEAYDYQRRLRPSLASRLEIVDDTTLRYTLHEGATFHDGRPVTSTSVKEIIEWVQNPDNGSWVGGPLTDVTVEAPDAQTVVIKLPKPFAGIRRALADLPIIPVDSIESQGTSPLGCGPYIFEEYVRDSHLAYRANPNFRNSDAPRLDSVRIRHFADVSSALQAFLAGESDFTEIYLSGMIPEFKSREASGELKTYVGFEGFSYLAFNCEKPPFDNPQVRKAFRLAIDRAPLGDIPFGGVAPAWPVPMLPDSPYYPEGLEAELSVHDPEEAKRLLSEAGVQSGFTVKLLVNNLGYPELQGTILQSQLAEVGITIELEVMDVATLLDRRKSGDFGILLLGNLNDPEPTAILARHFRTGATWASAYRYSNPTADPIWDAAAATFDDAERKQLYEQALRIALIDDTAMVSFCPEAKTWAFKPWTNAEQYGPPLGLKFEVVSKSTT
jgi:peptide/nickel transport system substrate-binding protein